MDLEYWWLLVLPLAFGLGWAAARFDIRQLMTEHTRLPRSYFKGLNFLLNEQPDQAIDAFIEVAKLDPETVELHFALGNLFRRRGETERAIRVHQNLVNRPDLPATDRAHALFDLGQDFLKAGMLDRAESTLNLLADSGYAQQAKICLLEIYEIEKDWQRAITIAQELQQTTGSDYSNEIAHFYCELAQDALRKQQSADVHTYLVAALQAQPHHARAMLLQADAQFFQNETPAAMETWRRIQATHPAYLPLFADKLMQAYTQSGQAEAGLDWLCQQVDSSAGLDMLDVIYRHSITQHGAEPTHQLMRTVLLRNPSLAVLSKLAEARAALVEGEARTELEVIKNLLLQRTRHLARYTCNQCGFRARLFYWQCPGCNHWETYSPRRTEVLGAAGASM